MQIAIHTGSHFTEEERLIRCLIRNKQKLYQTGSFVPGPSKYRGLLKKTVSALEGAAPAEEARDVLIDAILEEENASRLVLSHMFLFGAPRECVRDGLIYHSADRRLALIDSLFAEDQLEVFMAIRNPASLLPYLLSQSPQHDMDDFLRGADPYMIRWSDTFKAMRAAAPNTKLTVWCYEDLPFIWGRVLRALGGVDEEMALAGEYDMLSEVMSSEGVERLAAYLKLRPELNDDQKTRAIQAFLEKFLVEDATEEEVDAPGWTENTIDKMTEIYEDDVYLIDEIPGLELILP